MSALVTPAAADILRDARKLLADPARWLKGALSTDGQNVATWDRETCFCVDGATMFARHQLGLFSTFGAGACLGMVAQRRGFETASRFNDAPGTTHADVLALLDEAIALAESLAGAES